MQLPCTWVSVSQLALILAKYPGQHYTRQPRRVIRAIIVILLRQRRDHFSQPSCRFLPQSNLWCFTSPRARHVIRQYTSAALRERPRDSVRHNSSNIPNRAITSRNLSQPILTGQRRSPVSTLVLSLSFRLETILMHLIYLTWKFLKPLPKRF